VAGEERVVREASEKTSATMKIVVLAGGIGGARFLRGLAAAAPDAEVTVIGNTGDDITLFGLRVCPDLDTVMYTLGGGINEEQGWGRSAETFSVREELAAYGVGPSWFTLGDRDFATHIVRTQMLDAGYPLSAVTQALCERWRPGVRLIPMSDDRVETHVVIADESAASDVREPTARIGAQDSPASGRSEPSTRRAIHFQEWWVRLHASVPAESIVAVGAEDAKPAPGVLEAIEAADLVLLPPSNPVVSIGTILSVPGIRPAVAAKRAIGVSPIIGGAPVRGMADACLSAIGVETSAQAVAAHYGPDLLAGWLVDTADAGAAVDGIAVRARPLLMTDVPAAADIAAAALELARDLGS
jgi:LPPG:FO 2-phospho-L-lactate transferase